MSISSALFSSNSVEWETPLDLFDSLNSEFSFTLDPCCTFLNRKCEKFYTVSDNGLSKSWQGEVVFCNPPYGRDLKKWIKKCYSESCGDCTCVLLIPARTDTAWFHDYIYRQHEIRFIRGRLHFNGSFRSAPFPSMIVVMRSKRGHI